MLCPVAQVVVVLASFVLSTCLFPILISIITTSLISMDSLREEFQRKVEAWDQYMAHRRLPLDLRDKIRLAMDYRWRTRRAIDEVRPPAAAFMMPGTKCPGVMRGHCCVTGQDDARPPGVAANGH